MRVALISLMVAAVLALPTAASATTCVSMLSVPSADVVIDAVALPGLSAPDGTLSSPATFEVVGYVKGTGPDRVEVQTSTTVHDGMVQVIAGGIAPRAGETWRILATATTDLTRPIPTLCTQSARIDEAAAPGHEDVEAPSPDEPQAMVPWWGWPLLVLPLTAAGVVWHRGRQPDPLLKT